MQAFQTIFSSPIQVWEAIVAVAVTLVSSVAFAFLYARIKRADGFFRDLPLTFAILPLIITVLTMAVTAISDAYVGTAEAARYGRLAIAILGALIVLRFRSEQRNTEDLTYIFFLVAVGFLSGMGYIIIALILYVLIVAMFILLNVLHFPNLGRNRFEIRITVPEDLNYEEAFEDLFKEYSLNHRLMKTKSTDMGSLFVLYYDVSLKKDKSQKEFVDKIRERNGNLDIVIIAKQFLEYKK